MKRVPRESMENETHTKKSIENEKHPRQSIENEKRTKRINRELKTYQENQ